MLSYLFSCTLPEPRGRQMGEMLVLNPIGNIRVMMAKSFSMVYEL
jgi:hypothetical protein